MMYNSIRTIILWQLAGSVAFLIILAVWALKSKRDILAAVSLALASIKPQMVFLILPLLVIWALLNKRSRFVLSLVLSLGMLAGLSFISIPSWLGDMLNQIRQYPSYTTPALLYVITGSFPI